MKVLGEVMVRWMDDTSFSICVYGKGVIGRHGYFNNFDDVVGDIIKYVEKLGNGANKKIFLFGRLVLRKSSLGLTNVMLIVR